MLDYFKGTTIAAIVVAGLIAYIFLAVANGYDFFLPAPVLKGF